VGGSSKAQVVGHRYSFDIHFALGKKVDALCAIRASGKTAWEGEVTENQQVRISAPNLFGGDKGEGGLDGTLDLMFGDEDQELDSIPARLRAMLGGLVPAFRGISTGFYSGLISSMNPYPKKWELRMRGGQRLWDGNPWYLETMFIWLADYQIKAMNPVHMLYLVYTGTDFRNLPRSRMDEEAWRAAALTVFNEELGLSFAWKRSDSFSAFCDTVKAHLGAEVFPDRRTGLISIRLLRDDYVVDDLPLFDEDSGLLDITKEQAGSTVSASSQMVVKYRDGLNGETRQVVVVNSAVAASAGRRSTETVEYFGAPTAEIAGRLGLRDMRAKTAGLKRFKVMLDRRGRWLTPGQPFRIRSRLRGIEELVVRAGRIEDDFLGTGVITVTVLQDEFSLPRYSTTAAPPPGWQPPDRTPLPVLQSLLFEAPYRELAQVIDPANLALVDPSAAYLAAVAVAPSGLTFSYTLATRPVGAMEFVDRGTGAWCPFGSLAQEMWMEPYPNAMYVGDALDLESVSIGQALLVGDEIVRVDQIEARDGWLMVGRGCADTVPADHPVGTPVWFYDGFESIDETPYSAGVTVEAQMLTNTSIGQLEAWQAPTQELTLIGRQGRPYPPGMFLMNGLENPLQAEDEVAVSWAHRDRVQQADQLVDSSLGDIGPEPGTTYTVRMLRADDGSVLESQAGITGNSFTLSPVYQGAVTIELWSERGHLESLQRHHWTLEYTRQEEAADEPKSTRQR